MTMDGPPISSTLTLLRVGFTEPPSHLDAGALLPHRFTLTCARSPGPSAVYFLLHFPASHLDWPLASTLPCGAPTFLSPGPGKPRPKPRPPSQLTVAYQYSTRLSRSRVRIGVPSGRDYWVRWRSWVAQRANMTAWAPKTALAPDITAAGRALMGN